MGTTVEKADYAFETKDLLKTEINKINNVLTDNSTFRSYPQELFNGYLDILNNGADTLWNNLEKVSASGEEATLENVETAPMKVELQGNTQQNGEPTPDTPIPVQVVKGENVVSVSGKNLFDKNLFQNFTDAIKFISLNLKPNTQYTVSSDIPSSYNSANLFALNSTGNPSTTTNGVTPSTTRTITTLDDGILRIGYRDNGNVLEDEKNNYWYQVEEGSTATPYVPYSKTDYPINLGNLELCKIGTYKDYLFKRNGKWYVHKEIGKKIFNGTETWNISGTNTADVYRMQTAEIKNYILPPTATSIPVYVLCSRFIVKSADDTYKKIEGISSSSVGNIHIYMNDYNTSTSVNNFKTWLSNNNVTLYYVLATPTEEEITNTTLIEQLEAISKAKSVKDKTYITQTNDELPFILDVEAIKEYSVE